MASTVEVDVNIAALMDSDLPGYNHQDTIRHPCDMDWTVDATRDDEAVGYVLDGKTGESSARGCRDRHVDDAVAQIRQSARGSGPSCRGWKNDMETRVVGNTNVPGS